MDASCISPAEWDRIVASEARSSLPELACSDSQRAVLAVLYRDDLQALKEALPALAQDASPLAPGARLLALCELGQYQAVLTAPRRAQGGYGALELENACNEALAVAVAAAEQSDIERAIGALATADALAGLVGMVHRQQLIGLERERLAMRQGQARPARIQAVMDLTAMSPMRTAFAGQVLAAAHLALGDYEKAAQLGGAVGDLARALAKREASPLPSGEYQSTITAIRAYREARLAEVMQQAEDTPYMPILRAAVALQQDRPVEAVLLLGVPPQLPDQRFYWGLVAWEVLQRGGQPEMRPLEIHQLIVHAAAQLHMHGDVARFAHELAPVAACAMQFAPGSPVSLRQAAAALPVLLGEHILLDNVMHKLPGQRNGGQALLLMDMGHERTLSRVERGRLKRALSEVCKGMHPTGVHHLLRALMLMREQAVFSERRTWNIAVTNVLDQVSGKQINRLLSDAYGERRRADA